jgi:hypothetical protein
LPAKRGSTSAKAKPAQVVFAQKPNTVCILAQTDACKIIKKIADNTTVFDFIFCIHDF